MSDDDNCSLTNVIKTVWGGNAPSSEVFLRWSQPIIFSEVEPAALVQLTGGPCGVLASLQAHIIRFHYFGNVNQSNVLIYAIHYMLTNAASTNRAVYVCLPTALLNEEMEFDKLHSSIRLEKIDVRQPMDLRKYDSVFKGPFGMMLFIYGLVASRGVSLIQQERFGCKYETSEGLIESVLGHGSIALTLLCLIGRALEHTFDGQRTLEGMTFNGIEDQPLIGYLSYLEVLRYVEIGSFLKNPLYPIWLLATESHITVLFSKTKNIPGQDFQMIRARGVFNLHDTESRGFVSVDELKLMLDELNLESDQSYVEFLIKRLDPDDLGIILRQPFLCEVCPRDFDCENFEAEIFHWNGLHRTSLGPDVCFTKGILRVGKAAQPYESKLVEILLTRWSDVELVWFQHTPFVD